MRRLIAVAAAAEALDQLPGQQGRAGIGRQPAAQRGIGGFAVALAHQPGEDDGRLRMARMGGEDLLQQRPGFRQPAGHQVQPGLGHRQPRVVGLQRTGPDDHRRGPVRRAQGEVDAGQFGRHLDIARLQAEGAVQAGAGAGQVAGGAQRPGVQAREFGVARLQPHRRGEGGGGVGMGGQQHLHIAEVLPGVDPARLKPLRRLQRLDRLGVAAGALQHHPMQVDQGEFPGPAGRPRRRTSTARAGRPASASAMA